MNVTFNGRDLSDYFYIGEPIRPLPDYQAVTASPSGRRGALFMRSDLGTISLTVPLAAKVTNTRSVRDCFRWLAGTLAVNKLCKLEFSDEGGYYRMAIPQGMFMPDERLGYGVVDITFLQPDPALYGETKTITVPSGGSVSFTVGGNTYAMPKIEASAVRDATSLVWGVRLDSADFIHIATGNAAARKIVCDCANRTLTIAGATALPTLDSDWLQFDSGSHSLAIDNGTGAATVTFTERWLQ